MKSSPVSLRLLGVTHTQPDHRVDSAVIDALGRHAFTNIERGLPKPERRQEFLDAYRRRYQSFRDALAQLSLAGRTPHSSPPAFVGVTGHLPYAMAGVLQGIKELALKVAGLGK